MTSVVVMTVFSTRISWVLRIPFLGRVALGAQQPIGVKPSRERSVGWSVHPSVCPVHCGKTADRIRMPFGIIGRTGQGMRQVVGFGDRSTGRRTLGANLGRAIVINGDFMAYVCDSATTRPCSQITLDKLVLHVIVIYHRNNKSYNKLHNN